MQKIRHLSYKEAMFFSGEWECEGRVDTENKHQYSGVLPISCTSHNVSYQGEPKGGSASDWQWSQPRAGGTVGSVHLPVIDLHCCQGAGCSPAF